MTPETVQYVTGKYGVEMGTWTQAVASLFPAPGQRLIGVHVCFHSTNVEHLLGVEQIRQGLILVVLILEREEIDNWINKNFVDKWNKED